MRKSILIIVFLLAAGVVMAQRDSLQSKSLGLGYFSQGGFYPGFTLDCEKKLLSNNAFQLLLAAKAGAYFHYRNQTGVFVMIQSGQRFRLYKNLYFEHFLGVGYLHTFLNGGDAYYVSASGQVQKASDAGNPHFMPSVSFGLCYDFPKARRPLLIFMRPMIFWQIPFNRVSLVQYAFEVGALVKLKK